MNKQLQDKLKTYSLAAGAIAATGAAAEAQQIIHTDVDPDRTIDVGTAGVGADSVMIDINNDGTNDFKIQGNTWNGSLGGGTLYIAPLNNNAIFGAASTIYMPYRAEALDNADQICHGKAGWVGDALIVGGSPTSIVGNFKNAQEKYLGVRVVKEADTTYGWMRFSGQQVSVTLESMAISTGDRACIEAGTITGIEEELIAETDVYMTHGNELAVDLPEARNNAKIAVISSNGRINLSTDAHGNQNRYTLDAQPGVYLVKIEFDDAVISKKVYVD